MKSKLPIAVALVLGLLLGVVAGRWVWKAQERTNTELAEPGDVTDRALMVALDQAKNFHHKAKVYMSDGNLAAATASVRQILSLRFPPNAPEAEDVRLDARALLAKLLISQGQLEEAMLSVDEGIAQSTRKSFFLANVYTVKGEIYEARALQADAAGNAAKAAEERHAAISAFDQSIQINETLQKQLEDK
jgi:tetratricopeptide (TPR) repeat protein